MSDSRQDAELRALFDEQRREDVDTAPAFAEMLARARADAEVRDAEARDAESRDAEARDDGQRSAPAASTPSPHHGSGISITTQPIRIRHRREWIGALAAAAAIAAVLLIPRVNNSEDAFEQAVRAFGSDPALGAWQSPTDGLLSLPGDRLLTTVPALGIEQ